MAEYGNEKGVLFSDGELAIGFHTPGDTVPMGPDAIHKYARNFHRGGEDVAVIKTKSGNKYFLCNGVLFDRNDNYVLINNDIALTPEIGKPMKLPNGQPTTPVESVLLRYKFAGNPSAHKGPKVNTPNPFQAALDRSEQIHRAVSRQAPPPQQR